MADYSSMKEVSMGEGCLFFVLACLTMKISSNTRRAGFAFSKRDDASSEIEKVDELIAGTKLKDNARSLGVWYSARVG